jgi:cytosine/uracil/thiamine/allantoin permease
VYRKGKVMVEQRESVEFSERLYNEDLAPAKERRWGSYSLVKEGNLQGAFL